MTGCYHILYQKMNRIQEGGAGCLAPLSRMLPIWLPVGPKCCRILQLGLQQGAGKLRSSYTWLPHLHAYSGNILSIEVIIPTYPYYLLLSRAEIGAPYIERHPQNVQLVPSRPQAHPTPSTLEGHDNPLLQRLKTSRKHKDLTNHGFWNPPCLGP